MKLAILAFLISGITSFSEEAFVESVIQNLPTTERKLEKVYGTFGVNAGLIPTFNAAVGYQGKAIGIDLQSNLFLIIPIDVSSHIKVGKYTRNGNFYAGVGPFYSGFMGFGGEVIGGYRSIPKAGLGWFVEGFGRPISTGTRKVDKGYSDAVATYIGAGLAGVRAGIAF